MRRLVFLCAALVAAGASASVAGASPPTRVPYSFSVPSTLQGVCSFDVSVNSSVIGTETFFSEPSGSARIEVHQIEVDTFMANGITLTGAPYTTNIHAVIDANGNLISEESTGEAESVVLPDGTITTRRGEQTTSSGRRTTPTPSPSSLSSAAKETSPPSARHSPSPISRQQRTQ